MQTLALCATHPELPASGSCPRCGELTCSACMIPSSELCQACRQATAKPPERAKVPAWAGVVALFFGGIGAQLVGGVPFLIAVAMEFSPGDSVDALVQSMARRFGVLGPSILATGLTMAAVAIAVPLIAKVPLRRGLGLRGAPWPAFVMAPVGILALGPTSDALRRAMQHFLPWFTFGALEGLDEIARSAPLYLVLPAMALVPGICEELLFRGMFQRSMKRGWVAVVLSGTLFAAYHMDPQHVVAVLPLGLYLAWLGYRTDSIFVPITGHVFNNAAAVLGSTLLADTLGPDEPLDWWWVPAGWAVAAVAIGVIYWSTRSVEAHPRA